MSWNNKEEIKKQTFSRQYSSNKIYILIRYCITQYYSHSRRYVALEMVSAANLKALTVTRKCITTRTIA
jgi:hypothetical protein